MSVLPANFEKSTIASARSAGASRSECWSTFPTSNRVGSVIHVVGCWPSMTVGAGRKPPSLPIAIQSGPAVAAPWTGFGGDHRVGLGRREVGGVEGDFGRADDLAVAVQVGAGRGGIAHVPLEVEEAVVRRIEHPESVGLRLQRDRRVGGAVDDRRVIELFHADRDVRRAGDLLRLAERVGVVLPARRVVEVAGRVVVRVRDRPVLRVRGRRPEPRPVHPAPVGAHATRVARVLGRHVHVVVPEAALGAPSRGVPGRVLQGELGGVGDERAVLDDERDGVRRARDRSGVEELLLGLVCDQVAGCLTGVHVEPGDAPRVVVVEEQPGALLVGVVEGLAPVVGRLADVHVGHVLDTDALRPVRGLAGRRDPLVRGAVADPRGGAAVQVQRRPVVRETALRLRILAACGIADRVHDRAFVCRLGHIHREHAGAHERGVGRKEQVAVGARRQEVMEDDPDRLVLRCGDRRAKPLRWGHGEPRGDRRRSSSTGTVVPSMSMFVTGKC